MSTESLAAGEHKPESTAKATVAKALPPNSVEASLCCERCEHMEWALGILPAECGYGVRSGCDCDLVNLRADDVQGNIKGNIKGNMGLSKAPEGLHKG